VLSTGYLARDGHILVPQGCELASYRANPIWLWSHDPLVPVGRCKAHLGDDLVALDADLFAAPETIGSRFSLTLASRRGRSATMPRSSAAITQRRGR
jgi:hypothetical protein